MSNRHDESYRPSIAGAAGESLRLLEHEDTSNLKKRGRPRKQTGEDKRTVGPRSRK